MCLIIISCGSFTVTPVKLGGTQIKTKLVLSLERWKKNFIDIQFYKYVNK